MINPLLTGLLPNAHYGQSDSKTTANDFNARASDPKSLSETNKTTSVANKTTSVANKFDVNEVVSNLMNFVKSRVAMAPPEQQEALLAQARQGIETGFGQAAEMLEQMGRLNESFAEGMGTAQDKLQDYLKDVDSLMSYDSADSSVTGSLKTDVQSLYYRNKESLSLSLTTREGDRIEISYSSDNERSATSTSGSDWTGVQWGQSQYQQFELVVKGDLNDKEKDALNQLLADVDKLASEFYDGDLDKAFDMASSLKMDMSQLSSLDLNMTEVDVVGVASYQRSANEFEGVSKGLPKGLSPLQEYARQLVDSLESVKHKGTFKPKDLFELMDIHPVNQPRQSDVAKALAPSWTAD